ncbi:MAG: acetolactate synthase small subunit [Bacteroidetes bacterium 4572_117]|nr:MAG: acetolactate synthase small subunit [Bacteroidetes bacterium 4572_117]
MKRKYTLLIYTENHIGLLNRVSIIFTRRKVNIESLTTSPSRHDGIHTFVIVVNTTRDMVEKIQKQIEKQIEVLKAFLYDEDMILSQEVALYKVSTAAIARNNKIEELVRNSNGRILDIEPEYIVIEKTGNQQETQEFLEKLAPYDVHEFIRSGRVVITKPMKRLQDHLKDMQNLGAHKKVFVD